MFSKLLSFISRAIEAALILLGVAIAVLDDHTIIYIAIWDVLALVYLVTRMSRFRRSKKQLEGANTDWMKGMLGLRTGTVFTVLTSITGITAGLLIVLDKGQGDSEIFSKVVGVPAVLIAWAILQFGYAERYAKLYYATLPEQVLVFPNTDRPNFIDFAYFSFTLGTTFSVSDVETQTSRIRAQILSHSILSFIYNTATLGIAVGVITG